MKPLSVMNYTKNNKKKVVIAITCICVSVFLLYTFHIIFSSLGNTVEYVCYNPLKHSSMILPASKTKPLSDDLIRNISQNESTDRVIPAANFNSSFFTLAWDNSSSILGMKEEDIPYYMEKQNLSLRSGRLPRTGEKEIALDYRIAGNKGLKLGDKFGHSANKLEELPGEYEIVGILEGPGAVGIYPLNTRASGSELLKFGMIAFSKDGRNAELDEYLRGISTKDASVSVYSLRREMIENYMMKSANTIINLIMILAIVVMSVSVGNSIYVHFLERRKEFGVLGAIGYSQTRIVMKALYEITFMNITGFISGIALGLLCGYLLKTRYFDIKGLLVNLYLPDALLQALCVPIFTTLFTLIPIYRMIKKIDPINIIEGVS